MKELRRPSRPSRRLETSAQELGATVRGAQNRGLWNCAAISRKPASELERMREGLSAERARRASIEQILSERAYTADAVQKLFNVAREHGTRIQCEAGFHAVGLLADYAEVQEKYEGAIEQFLRDELEYVVVESFDHARAGISLLRDEMGGRATFFVDSLSKLNICVAGSRCFTADACGSSWTTRPPGRLPRTTGVRREAFSHQAAYRLRRRNRSSGRAHGERKSAQLFSHSRWHVLSRPHGFRRTRRRSRTAGAEARVAPARNGSAAAGAGGKRATSGNDAAEKKRLRKARSKLHPLSRAKWKRKNLW